MSMQLVGETVIAQARVTVTETGGIVWRMRFMIVCKKLKEKIARNIIVAY